MYLLVFVTLVVSLIGVYVQVLALQTARIYASQTGVAQAMLQWHSAAISMAASVLDTKAVATGYSPCSLTDQILTGVTNCPSPKNGLGGPYVNIKPTGATAGTVAYGTSGLNFIYKLSSSQVECVHLPATCPASGCISGSGNQCTSIAYDITKYQFYSVLYPSALGQNYVVTFVMPPTPSASNPPPGFFSLATGVQTGLTLSDLLQQFQHSGTPTYTYGTVKVIGGTSTLQALGVSYTLPSSVFDASTDGAVAVITSPDGF